MSDEHYKTVCYFDGASVDAIRDALVNEYPSGAIIRVKRRGESYVLNVCNAEDQGTDTNDSHPCPGSPNCT